MDLEISYANETPLVEELKGEKIEKIFEREGLDFGLLYQPFLEAGELGDADSLKARFALLSADERRQLVRAVDQHGRTGLLLAARRGDAASVDVLLDAGANPNDADSSGTTALHYAASRGSSRSVELLLHARAAVDQADDRGDTPLMWATNKQVVELLLTSGANINAKGGGGRTPLIYLAATGDVEAVKVLTATRGLELDEQDAAGISAHAAAVQGGHTEVASLLLGLGAKATAKSPDRLLLFEEALHEAARAGDAAALTSLFARSAAAGGQLDVDVEVAGDTALLLAASSGAGRAVEVLLQARADPRRSDPFMKETPLHRAAMASSSCLLLMALLEAKADPSAEDLSGRTAADVASAWGHTQGAELLKAATALGRVKS